MKQCNALINLVDETYYSRAWRTVEVMLFQKLTEAYHLHERWQHRLKSSRSDRVEGALTRGSLARGFDVSRLKLTHEELDRPKIEFLIRQSRLLGRDDDG